MDRTAAGEGRQTTGPDNLKPPVGLEAGSAQERLDRLRVRRTGV